MVLVLAVACTPRGPGTEHHRSSSAPQPDPSVRQDSATRTVGDAQETMSYMAGGTTIWIPSPTSDFAEVGYDNRQVMDELVPQANRLVCGFVLMRDVPLFGKADSCPHLVMYALVEVPRSSEFVDYEVNGFQKVVEVLKENFYGVVPRGVNEAEAEYNRRMISRGLDERRASVHHPVNLGCFFSKEDAYGYGIAAAISTGNVTDVMAVGAAVLRVKKRLLLLYLHSQYEDEGTVSWLRSATETWCDAILRANAGIP